MSTVIAIALYISHFILLGLELLFVGYAIYFIAAIFYHDLIIVYHVDGVKKWKINRTLVSASAFLLVLLCFISFCSDPKKKRDPLTRFLEVRDG